VKTARIALCAAVVPALLAAPAAAGTQIGARISPALRATLNRELDILVNDGVKRANPAAVYDIATPELKEGTTRKGWSNGSIPVYPYPAKGTRFHAWFAKYATSSEVGVEIMLQPRRGAKIGPILFDAYFDKVDGRWLFDELLPVATFAPTSAKKAKVRAITDYSPRGGFGGVSTPSKISSKYAYLPFAIVPGILLALLLVAAARSIAFRRRSEALPPLRGGGHAR
jgi:hypothetical protein